MNNALSVGNLISWLFGLLVFTTGIMNVLLVHPVPGIVYLFLAILYFPPVNLFLKERFGISIPPVGKIILGIVLIMFTLGVSDLGDMIDKL